MPNPRLLVTRLDDVVLHQLVGHWLRRSQEADLSTAQEAALAKAIRELERRRRRALRRRQELVRQGAPYGVACSIVPVCSCDWCVPPFPPEGAQQAELPV